MNEHSPKKASDDEIDLIELIQKVWYARKSILKVTLLFFVLGVLVALLSAKQYTATTIMIPQTSDDKMSVGGLGGLAAMAGINLGATSSEAIPMKSYSKIVTSIPFKQKLAQTLLTFEEIDKKITYEQYSREYAKPSVLGTILKYTIGLPSLLFGEKNEAKNSTNETNEKDSILSISLKESEILKNIDKQLVLDINEKEGFITLSYSMHEPIAAAQMLHRAQTLLQETVTAFKIQKASEELDFIKKRYNEAEKDFKAKQFALAQFQDRNRDLFSSLPQTRLQQLQTEFNLSFSVYSELAKQLETKQIKVKEDQPIFTIIEPVSIPNQRSKPQRIVIIAIWTFLGIIVGIGMVFMKDFYQKIKEQKSENE